MTGYIVPVEFVGFQSAPDDPWAGAGAGACRQSACKPLDVAGHDLFVVHIAILSSAPEVVQHFASREVSQIENCQRLTGLAFHWGRPYYWGMPSSAYLDGLKANRARWVKLLAGMKDASLMVGLGPEEHAARVNDLERKIATGDAAIAAEEGRLDAERP